jgi:hypothetical protein
MSSLEVSVAWNLIWLVSPNWIFFLLFFTVASVFVEVKPKLTVEDKRTNKPSEVYFQILDKNVFSYKLNKKLWHQNRCEFICYDAMKLLLDTNSTLQLLMMKMCNFSLKQRAVLWSSSVHFVKLSITTLAWNDETSNCLPGSCLCWRLWVESVLFLLNDKLSETFHL